MLRDRERERERERACAPGIASLPGTSGRMSQLAPVFPGLILLDTSPDRAGQCCPGGGTLVLSLQPSQFSARCHSISVWWLLPFRPLQGSSLPSPSPGPAAMRPLPGNGSELLWLLALTGPSLLTPNPKAEQGAGPVVEAIVQMASAYLPHPVPDAPGDTDLIADRGRAASGPSSRVGSVFPGLDAPRSSRQTKMIPISVASGKGGRLEHLHLVRSNLLIMTFATLHHIGAAF